MKKISLLLVCACVVTSLSLVSCKSTKSYSKTTKTKEVELPFAGKQYKSDANFFRASQSGISPNLSTAKNIALANARNNLAQEIEQVVKNVTQQYVNQRSIGDKQEYESKFEEMTVMVTKQTVNGSRVMAEKTFI
ncbi:hypothetical protein LJC25_00155, partial [Bacteroidales bacterium OttesenSCG-928-K03]|nr:hypothetical protein [Bacteroidales bacterium OttesenSCG-928-K03]